MIYRNHFTRMQFFQPVLQAPLFPAHMGAVVLDTFAETLPQNRQAAFQVWVEYTRCVNDEHRKLEQVSAVLLDLQEQHLREDHQRLTQQIETVERQISVLQEQTQMQAEAHKMPLLERHPFAVIQQQRAQLTLQLAAATSSVEEAQQQLQLAHLQATRAYSLLGLLFTEDYLETLRLSAPYRPLQDHQLIPQDQPHHKPTGSKRALHELISWLYVSASMYILFGGTFKRLGQALILGDVTRFPWTEVMVALTVGLGISWYASTVLFQKAKASAILQATVFHTASREDRQKRLQKAANVAYFSLMGILTLFILADTSVASVGLIGESMRQQTSQAIMDGKTVQNEHPLPQLIFYVVAAFFMVTMTFKRSHEGHADGLAVVAHQKTLETRHQAEIQYIETPKVQHALECAAQWESQKVTLKDLQEKVKALTAEAQALKATLEAERKDFEGQLATLLSAENLQMQRLKSEHQTLLLERENLNSQHQEFVANVQQALQQSAQYAAHTHQELMGMVRRHHRFGPTLWQKIVGQLIPSVAVKA